MQNLSTQHIFIKFGGKVVHRPRKKQAHFGGTPDHATLRLGLRYGWEVLSCRGKQVIRFLSVTFLRDSGYAVMSLILN